MGERSALSLFEYTRMMRGIIASDPRLREQWVTAELSDVSVRGGHCYMELVEKNEAGQTLAKMRATVWQSAYFRIRARFVAAAGREFASGIKLMLRGSASMHEVYGLSFNVSDVDPSYTLGDMERVRREILAALAREGIAECNRSLEISPVPQRIAVISAPGAAGYGDFMHQLCGNQSGIVFYVKLFESVMQGERAVQSVRSALEKIAMTIDLWDAVVIIRGGGATTDLNCFDNLELAREVACFGLPVIVGIGHERDRTVLDEIAHTRVKTPTAAAEFLLGHCQKSLRRAEDLGHLVVTRARDILTGNQRQLDSLATAVRETGRERVAKAMSRMDSATALLPAIVRRRVELASGNLRTAAASLPLAAAAHLRDQNRRLESDMAQLRQGIAAVAERARLRLGRISEVVDALSPEKTLRRGYSITLDAGGKAVRSVGSLREGDTVTTRLADGNVTSIINSKAKTE